MCNTQYLHSFSSSAMLMTPTFISSMWASMADWFTPTILFCILNLMIGTIFLASKHKSPRNNQDYDENPNLPTQLAQIPRKLLERVKSVNFSSFYTTQKSQHQQYPFQSETTNYNSSSQLTQSINSSSFYNPAESQNQDYYSVPGRSHNGSPSQLTNAPSITINTAPESKQHSPATKYNSHSRLAQSPRSSSFYTTPPEFPRHEPRQSHNDSLSQPANVPSLLERVKSIKLSSFYMQNNYPSATESDSEGQLGRVNSFKISSPSKSNKSGNVEQETHHVIRSRSVEAPAKKSSGKMKKSLSELRVPKEEEEEEVYRRRPATVREGRTSAPADQGVDAKADDFINRFKQQLKLQRLDSLLNFKEMLNRGTSYN